MRNTLKFLWLCAWALLLTACKGEPKEVVDVPVDPPAQGKLTIEAPKYFVIGEPAEIKLLLSGPESFSATGDLYFYAEYGTNSVQKVNVTPIKLDSSSAQAVIPIENPPLASAEKAVSVRIKFVWQDNNNYNRQTVSEVKVVHTNALTAGPTETIREGAEKILSASQNTLLEAIDAEGAEFNWQQIEGPDSHANSTIRSRGSIYSAFSYWSHETKIYSHPNNQKHFDKQASWESHIHYSRQPVGKNR